MHLKHRTRRFLAVLLPVLALAAGACGHKANTLPPGATQADKFLFDRGTDLLARKKWLRAREYFRQLVDNYPQSQYRPDAKLGLGDTYLGENTTESVILSLQEYREFLTFYPTNPRADYAQFKLGMAHYAQMLAPQRDQAETKEAIKEFEYFVERFPTSSLIEEGRKRLRECRTRLGDSFYTVGLFYWKTSWYPGAVERFKALLKDDPGYPKKDGVYFYLADSLAKAGLGTEALPYLEKLFAEFPKSEFTDRGHQLVKEIKNPPPRKPVKQRSRRKR